MEQQQNFLDSKTIIAIVLVGLVWFGWQSYISKKYPPPPKTEVTAIQNTNTSQDKSQVKAEETNKVSALVSSAIGKGEEKTFAYENSNLKFEISSIGMGIKNLVLKSFSDRQGTPIKIGAGAPYLPLSSYLDHSPLSFEIQKTSENEFVGRTERDGIRITKTIHIETDYTLTSSVKVEGNLQSKSFSYVLAEEGFEAANKDQTGKQMGGDPAQWQSYYVSHAGTHEHETTSETAPFKDSYDQVSVIALNGKYFGQAIVDDSPIVPKFQGGFDETEKRFLAWLNYDLSGQQSVELKAKFFAGPKSLAILTAADPRLEKSVNFGMFGLLASPLLKLMKWLYGLTLNYGVAIVLMTLLVRIAVAPFNLASFKSMKAMQVIQPQVSKLKEKYKEDPQALNREMMKLMKDNNANPLMGCLPMLLQLPVFFALYQVLDHSVELYKAPFMFWVHDLSLKDPYYVLPALMGITMFIQQKITPTTMDPAQARVMQIMPIVFTFLMVSLPSGLTLYIFISTLFGITQQYLFLRDGKKGQPTAAIQAKA